MPTANRRRFIPLALRCFLEQTWEDKELIVVDDGSDRVEDLFREVPGAHYFFWREPNLPAHRPLTPIGTKRNRACELARGEIICHWDDDDWSDPGRIEDQVERLLAHADDGRQVTGYRTLLFWNGAELYRYLNHDSQYAVGSSLCYRRDWWSEHRFLPTSFGEDTEFTAAARGHVIGVEGGPMMVARTHADNSCPRHTDGGPWEKLDASELPAGFTQCAHA